MKTYLNQPLMYNRKPIIALKPRDPAQLTPIELHSLNYKAWRTNED